MKTEIAFGKRVRELRKGERLEKLAEEAGLNFLQIGHIERGASDPNLSTLRKLTHPRRSRPAS